MRDAQDKLIRLAAPGPDQLRLEPRKGRGGYLHRDPNCQKAFVSRKSHYRAFHVEVSRKVKAEFIKELATRDRE
jgi:predicted RNA-binding protein YlxR (DUF448 family)